MSRYSVVHLSAIPENLSEGWVTPVNLNSAYVYYKGEDPDTPAVYQVPKTMDAQGMEVPASILEVVTAVAALMYADNPGPILLERTEALGLLGTPHWRIFAGQYNNETDLIADCQVLGITPVGPDLESVILDAQTKLKTLFII